MAPSVATNLDYLIPRLRLHLGDLDSNLYRYTDDWLQASLIGSIESLMRWWNYRYLLDENNDVYRNTTTTFSFDSPPIIEQGDIRPIVLMAAIIIKEGSLENSAWSLSSWRDSEISYSNLEGGIQRDKSLLRDWEELIKILGVPRSRLLIARKQSLSGYRDNPYEYGRNEP